MLPSHRGRAGGAVLPPDGPPTLLHPCLHEGYNRTYRRLPAPARQAHPAELVLLGRQVMLSTAAGLVDSPSALTF
jgi:hypothetical protein